jgi:two-component system, NtrC family, sensor kinase
MGRGQKPAKSKEAKPPVARKSPNDDGAKVRDLEKRLVEALRDKAETQEQLQTRDRELVEAQEQQTATAEILRVISSSPTDVQPVLEAAVQNASRLCAAGNVSLYRVEGSLMRKVAEHGLPLTALRVGETRPITRTSVSGRAVVDRATIHLPDHQSADAAREYPDARRDTGIRTTIGVPLLREGVAIGVFTAYRTESRSFAEREIALLKTFAAQAVIAIENVRLFKETKEALEQQTATSEVLKVISRSAFDLQPVLDTLIENAARLCGARRGVIFRRNGDQYHGLAFYNTSPDTADFVRARPISPGRHTITARVALERRTIHVADLQADSEYRYALRDEEPIRTELGVPMFRDNEIVGVIILFKVVVEPFTEKQIELVETFADQAVIAIQNVRLFTELQEKNRALTETLEQQTATSEILRVISSSPTDVQPVFEAVLASGVRLCGARFGGVFRFDGQLIHLVTSYEWPEEHLETVRRHFPMAPGDGSLVARAIRDRRVVQTPDYVAEARAGATLPAWVPLGETSPRSTIAIPMMREGNLLGGIVLARAEPGLFSDQHVALLQTFADQAVIALENVRLFNETKEALEQQTATSEILGVISQSPTDVQPVFDAIVDNAMRLFRAWAAAIVQLDGQLLHLIAVRGGRPGLDQYLREQSPWSIHGPTPAARCVAERTIIHIPDTESDRLADEEIREIRRRGGMRSVLAAPMLREGQPMGAIWISRAEAGPFSPVEIALLQTFADQAVIAIQNTRLLGELQARTQELSRSVERLTALGEVGRAVSSTLDLETVLTTIVSRAVQLSGLDGGVLFEYDEAAEEFVHRAAAETGGVLAQARRGVRYRRGEGALGRTAITLQPVQVSDITVPGAYDSRVRENLIESGVRAILAVPMVHQGQLIGCLGVTRNSPGAFPAETIELLRTFAAQSALAIQNARLFREIEEKSRQLEVASQHKSEFLANMSHELRTPLNAIIGFSEVLSDRMFGDLNEKQEEYLKDIYASGTHLLSLINDILDLSKIEAGRMELELTDFHLPTALDNALTLVRERAERRSITLQTSIDERLGEVRADERKIRQVVLNLLSNAIKFTPEGGRIEVAAVPRDGSVEVSVSDTGVGIAPEDQEKVFEEFQQVGTAAKKVEGTGLGLTLCRKFVELHGGKIWVKSELGAGSIFTFTIPLRRGG